MVKELKVPDLSGENPLKLSESIIKSMQKQLFPNGNKECKWCGQSGEHFIHPIPYTGVTFSIPQDYHVNNKVTPLIFVECRSCGKIDQFSMHALGYTTKRGKRTRD